MSDFPLEAEHLAAVEQLLGHPITDEPEQRFRAIHGENPYFVCHESPLMDTSVMDGHEVLNFGSYNYAGMSGRPETVNAAIEATRAAFQDQLTAAGHGIIITEVAEAPTFYYAEDYHQQYLAKVPNGYCGLGGTGVSCPIGLVG